MGNEFEKCLSTVRVWVRVRARARVRARVRIRIRIRIRISDLRFGYVVWKKTGAVMDMWFGKKTRGRHS